MSHFCGGGGKCVAFTYLNSLLTTPRLHIENANAFFVIQHHAIATYPVPALFTG